MTRTNYLASPPLVVAYALLGSTAVDITTAPIGKASDGSDVFLKDIWPTTKEVQEAVASFVTPQMFRDRYAEVFQGSAAWQAIEESKSELYPWDDSSTYIKKPPFFEDIKLEGAKITSLGKMRVLGLFGDSVTTDHISPAGSIAKDSPAAEYLKSKGVEQNSFNSYGSRRGNDEVMMRGTFANIRIKNRLTPGIEGNSTLHLPSGEQMSFFDAAEQYRKENTPLMVIAGKEYGSGSSRDWAAKGPFLQNIKLVIAESYERIHRSNLIGMGILPLQFLEGESSASHNIDGTEEYSVELSDALEPGGRILVKGRRVDGSLFEFEAVNRIDTPVEIQYYRDGGILRTVLKNLANNG
ncbi:UNVERIFIED_CONTAM: hypothetical protein GTU68_037081 [Idotea baltica]|nr:hypothetical protein [Idotea baltica]